MHLYIFLSPLNFLVCLFLPKLYYYAKIFYLPLFFVFPPPHQYATWAAGELMPWLFYVLMSLLAQEALCPLALPLVILTTPFRHPVSTLYPHGPYQQA